MKKRPADHANYTCGGAAQPQDQLNRKVSSMLLKT